jgi:hypothetical protein
MARAGLHAVRGSGRSLTYPVMVARLGRPPGLCPEGARLIQRLRLWLRRCTIDATGARLMCQPGAQRYLRDIEREGNYDAAQSCMA